MKLVEFLTKIATDDDWRRRFCDDPEAAKRRADLDEMALRALKSGNPSHVGYVICVHEAKDRNGFDPID